MTNRLLARLGSPVRYDAPSLQEVALGRSFRALAQGLEAGAADELADDELERWVAEEARVVTAHLAEVLRPDAGVSSALDELSQRFRLAVVSSSALRRLAACIEVTGLGAWFPPHLRFSAQDSLPTPTSKPDPAVYRHAVRELGLGDGAALAVEDAVAGVESAVAAGVTVVGNLVFVPVGERAGRARDLLAAGAHAVVDDWAGLVGLLDGVPGLRAPSPA